MSDVVHILRGFNVPVSPALKAGERRFPTSDSLSCGPLQPLTDISEWKAQRLSYWRSISDYEPEEGDDDFLGDPSDLVQARRVVIWLGTSLDSQLMLAWASALLRVAGARPEQVDVVQFHRNHRGIEILDLGMLNPEQFAAHPPPMSLTADDLAELEGVWSAIVSPDPSALVATLASPYERLSFFKRALRTLLHRYPEKASGVNATEMRTLHWIQKAAPSTPRIIGQVLADGFDAARAGTGGLDQCGDVWLFNRILRLGDPALAEPAIEIGGSRKEYRNTTVNLTPFGARVLAGEANFVDRNGIDDWVAGVHLQSEAGRVWFYDDGNLVRRS
jgi:hypothetical protein